MSDVIFREKYNFEFDPLRKYEGMVVEQALCVIGILTSFILQDYLEVTTGREAFDKNCNFPITWSSVDGDPNLIVTSEGVFKYSGDPDMFPLACFKNYHETIYIYKSGWVVIEDKHGMIKARID